MSDDEKLDEVKNENRAAAEVDSAGAATATAAPESTTAEAQVSPDTVEPKVPQFASLGQSVENGSGSMSRFLDVSVQVSAELGSIRMPIGDMLQLGEGSVLELNRSLSEPIDLVAQGVRIARGEVVVIDDCFAIRIKEIESNQAN